MGQVISLNTNRLVQSRGSVKVKINRRGQIQPPTILVSDEHLEYWAAQFKNASLKTMMQFVRFIQLPEDHRQILLRSHQAPRAGGGL